MNTLGRLLTSVLVIFVAVSCTRNTAEQVADHEHEESETGVTFNVSRGLFVPPETARFIGLKTTDVEERIISSKFRFSAQVYRTSTGIQPASLRSREPGTTLASADLAPDDARAVRQGQHVMVELDSGTSVSGRITEIHPHNAKVGGHMDVTVAVDDKGTDLRPGAFVTVRVPVVTETAVVSVPRSAILQTAEGEFVYTASGEYFVRVPVKTGIGNAEYVEIRDGLYAGDTVVVNPVMSLWMAELQSIRGGKACADGH